MTQLYWQVYLNLEREFLELADTIFINEAQLNVYSMRISEMLIRTVIEIEALTKDLYLENGGLIVPDEKMYFDTVCMDYLDQLWNLDKKAVLVVSPNIYLEKEENRIIYPLHKANKRGTSSSDWNKAYQAVKHNRVKELPKGNIKHLLHGLAALYVLNLYYKDIRIDNLSHSEKMHFNNSFGSSLFTVKIHQINNLPSDGSYPKKSDFDECIYIEDYMQSTKQSVLNALKEFNNYINRGTQAELEHLIKEKHAKGETVSVKWIQEVRNNLSSKLLPIKDHKLSKQLNDSLTGIRYMIVLNKNQY